MFCGASRPVGAVILGFVNFLVWWGLGRRGNRISMGIFDGDFSGFLMGFAWGFDEGFFGT
jgi:hypothetical protein